MISASTAGLLTGPGALHASIARCPPRELAASPPLSSSRSRTAAIRPLGAACAALVDGVRLKNGVLQDDVGIALAEPA